MTSSSSEDVFGMYYNFAGFYGLPIVFGTPYIAMQTEANPLFDTTSYNNHCNNFVSYTPDGTEKQNTSFSDSSDGALEPASKRRRLSMQSDSSCPDSVRNQDFLSCHGTGFPQEALTLSSTSDLESVKKISALLKYNKKMVRKFPQKHRTAKEQERRDKNTLACRISRCKEKIKNIAIEEQRKVFTQQAFELSRESMKKAAYLNELLKYGAIVKSSELNRNLIDQIATKLNLKFLENIPTETSPQTDTKPGKRPFSVAFLLGLN